MMNHTPLGRVIRNGRDAQPGSSWLRSRPNAKTCTPRQNEAKDQQFDWPLFACAPLTRHLARALQAEGLDPKAMTRDLDSVPDMLVIAESDRDKAIAILLRELSELKLSPGLNSELVRTLAS